MKKRFNGLILVVVMVLYPLLLIISQPKTEPVPKAKAVPEKNRSYDYYKIIETRNIFKPIIPERPVVPKPPPPKPKKTLNTCGVTYNNKLKQYELIVEDPKEKKISSVRKGDSILGKKILRIELDHVILSAKGGAEEKVFVGDTIIEEEKEEE